MVCLVVLDLDYLLTATTKKRRQLFWKKVHPRQNPGYDAVFFNELVNCVRCHRFFELYRRMLLSCALGAITGQPGNGIIVCRV